MSTCPLLLLCSAIIMDVAKRNIPPHVVLVGEDELMSRLAPSDAEAFSSMQVVKRFPCSTPARRHASHMNDASTIDNRMRRT